MKNILIIGATSAIATACARRYAERGDTLCLVARNEERLQSLCDDLTVRGAAATSFASLDVNDFEQHIAVLEQCSEQLGGHLDLVLIAHGTLPDQKACEHSAATALQEINTNALSTVSLLTHLANRLEMQKSGTLAVITSVAGLRGRQSNYVYGAAKSMVSTFLQGLRNRLYPAGVQVIDIKPGFVDTPMTRDFDKGPLWAQPEDIAQAIIQAVDKGKAEVYAPFFWRTIMLLIRAIPESLFKRLKL